MSAATPGYIGLVESGSTLLIYAVCKNGTTGANSAPTGDVTYAIEAAADGTQITSGNFTASNWQDRVGHRTASITISGSYTRGQLYRVVITYVVSGVTITELQSFNVG